MKAASLRELLRDHWLMGALALIPALHAAIILHVKRLM
jgi:hypothetical protein